VGTGFETGGNVSRGTETLDWSTPLVMSVPVLGVGLGLEVGGGLAVRAGAELASGPGLPLEAVGTGELAVPVIPPLVILPLVTTSGSSAQPAAMLNPAAPTARIGPIHRRSKQNL